MISRSDFLFSRDASTTARVVAMAVRFYAEFGAVKAFTRGALCLSDNFDTVAGRVCAVENFAFGGAKTYLEHVSAHRFVSDHMQWPDARVLASLPVFAKCTDRLPTLEAAMEAHPEYRALYDAPNSTLAAEAYLILTRAAPPSLDRVRAALLSVRHTLRALSSSSKSKMRFA